jgi:uroporphyrin-III C-methyltransferase/precorrin-2 dehydrogenase/sirohydrochlorin ferrochelatase
MDSFPIFIRLQGRDALVVGHGEMAAAKRRLLEAAGARVSVAADAPDSCKGYVLVFGASGIDAVDRAVSARARAQGVPVNVVDRPELSDFIMPAVIDRGDVVIAVSTNGASPILSQRVRGWIEDALPARLDRLAAFARRFRQAVQTRIPVSAARRRFWGQFFEGEAADLVLAGREHQAARAMIRDLNGDAAGFPVQSSLQEFHFASDNPDDLTLGMLRALRNADVIAHDESLPAAILDYARRDASRIAIEDLSSQPKPGFRIVALYGAQAEARITAGAGR